MLTKRFDAYTIAHFLSMDEVDKDEVAQADVVTVLGKQPGGIYHSVSMRWKCFLDGQPANKVIRSHKERQSLEKNNRYFLDQGYTFEVKEMAEKDYQEFKTLYDNTTQKKERAVRYNLEDKLHGRILVGTTVYCAGMYKDEHLVSGLAFTVTDNKEALVSFGAKQKFQEVRGGVGGVLECNLIEFCINNNVRVIDHGKSFNPAGMIAKAGLFEFKARYGNSAYPEGEWITTYILNPSIVLSDLVFVTTINDQVGYTIVTEDPKPTTERKYLTKLVKNTQVLSLKDVVTSAKNALA